MARKSRKYQREQRRKARKASGKRTTPKRARRKAKVVPHTFGHFVIPKGYRVTFDSWIDDLETPTD